MLTTAASEHEIFVWYVGYGSNLAPERFARYLDGFDGAGYWRTRTVIVPVRHRRYFAGNSRTWGGPVAFIEREPSPCVQFLARGYLLDLDEIREVARRENGVRQIGLTASMLPREVGAALRLAVELDSRGSRGKYDLLVRLPDIDDGDGPRQAYTLTTSHDLEIGTPPHEYMATIQSFEAEHPWG